MKKFYLLGLSIILALIIPVSVFAYTKTSESSINISQNEVIDDDVFVAADSLTIDGIVNGDVYAVAGRVTVRGTVNGDVIAAGRLVEVTGVISDDLRAVGNSVNVTSSAKIGDSMSVAGSDVTLSNDSSVEGGVIAAGASVALDGAVGRGITAGSDELNINGPVVGNVNVAASKLAFGENADIKGKTTYRSTNKADISDGSKFTKEPDHIKTTRPTAVGSLVGAKIISAVIGFAMAFVTGLAVIFISKRHVRHVGHRISSKPSQSIAVGLVALLAGVPATIFLFITLVGIPLGVITLVLWGIGLYIAKIFTAVAVGDWVMRKQKAAKTGTPNIYQALAFGLAAYYLLGLLPFVGGLIAFLVTTAGFGGLLNEVYISVGSHRKTADD